MLFINLYGAPLAQRASYLALHSSLFGPVEQLIMIILSFGTAQFSLWASGTANYDYIVTNNIDCQLIGSRCISNGAHISGGASL